MRWHTKNRGLGFLNACLNACGGCRLLRNTDTELRMCRSSRLLLLPWYGDLERARQIGRSRKPLDHLAHADAEIVAKAIAEGIAAGRRHGLEIAQTYPEWLPCNRSKQRDPAAAEQSA